MRTLSGNASGIVSRQRFVLATLGFLLVAGFFLLTEHRAHLFGVLPYLFLLACPLLHVLGHGGHGGHGAHRGQFGAAADGAGQREGHAGHRAGLGGVP